MSTSVGRCLIDGTHNSSRIGGIRRRLGTGIILLLVYVAVCVLIIIVVRDGAVGISARFGLCGPGIESRLGGEGEIFCTCPDRPWDPPSLPYKGYRMSFP